MKFIAGLILVLVQVTFLFSQSCVIADYPFNGNANDETGNGIDGVIFGAIPTADRLGNDSSAYLFDGVDDFIELNNNIPIIDSIPFTITAWARMDGPGGGVHSQNPIFTQRDNSTCASCVALGIWPYDSQMGIEIGVRGVGGPQNTLEANPHMPFNEWHHYAMVASEDSFKLYINGNLIGQEEINITGNLTDSVDYVDIGRHRNVGQNAGFFNGAIDDVKIYNCALTQPEILQLVFGGEPNTISGNVYADANGNCAQDSAETGMKQVIVVAEPQGYFGITDNQGNYEIFTDTGSYQIRQIINSTELRFISQICPDSTSNYSVSFDSLGIDTSGFDFSNEVIECPLLVVDISSNRRRRCFENVTTVQYCNEGFADADSVKVHVAFPEFVHLVSADFPFTVDSNNVYMFNIGAIASNECGTIRIIDSVACVPQIMGLTQCTKAWITPANDCYHQLDTSYGNWDRSSINLRAQCENDSVEFTIVNNGLDMNDSSEYRIYVNAQLVETVSFILGAGQIIHITTPGHGQTIRLEADQNMGHPGNNTPSITIEACGTNLAGGFVTGFVTQFPESDADFEVEEHCLPIIDSWDPNDKLITPSGFTEDHIVRPDSWLDYTIRFQNTGSDTAYKVVVVDTLSPHLDIATLQFGASSHAYELNVSGQGNPVLSFNFNDIYLPDSTVDEPNSNGYIKFKVKPLENLPNGTVVHNFADIYFDFNEPIRTNDAWITISDTIVYACQQKENLLQMEICHGDSFFIGGLNQTTSGLYTDTLQAVNSCDSIIKVDLTVNEIDTTISFADGTLAIAGSADSYQWINCDGSPIAGETNQSFTPVTNGSYAVIINQNGCTAISSCYKVGVVSVTNYHDRGLKVYPNPTKDKFFIEFSGEDENQYTVEVSDLSGKKKLSQIIDAKAKNSIDLSEVSSGIYMVRVITVNQTYFFKILKE